MSMTGNTPLYTYEKTVTDGAEVSLTAQSQLCQAVYVFEQNTSTGWPRSYSVRGALAGSTQNPITPGTIYRFPGPFAKGDSIGTIELAANGGDTSKFNVQEAAS